MGVLCLLCEVGCRFESYNGKCSKQKREHEWASACKRTECQPRRRCATCTEKMTWLQHSSHSTNYHYCRSQPRILGSFGISEEAGQDCRGHSIIDCHHVYNQEDK